MCRHSRPRRWSLLLGATTFAACGDNDAVSVPPDAAEPEHFELALLPDYNQASETVVAASATDVVVLAIDQRFPRPDSFEYPATDDDPDHPFRRIAYATSHDRGHSFSASTPLVLDGRTDPVIGVAADGTFWAVATDPAEPPPYRTDVLRSSDHGATFEQVAIAFINDKPWLAVDNDRQALWVAGYPSFSLIGFDGTIRGTAQLTPGTGISAAYADTYGARFIDDQAFQPIGWDGVSDPASEGSPLPAGDIANTWTTAPVSLGQLGNGDAWIVRALHDSSAGSPIVVRVRSQLDEGSDTIVSAPNGVGFLPTAALDDEGHLHVVWYDSSATTGRLLYTRSVTADVLGAYTSPVVIDDDACPGGGWYPYSSTGSPPGGRRLREYIGLALMPHRAIVTWTHAPAPPSRVWVSHIDY